MTRRAAAVVFSLLGLIAFFPPLGSAAALASSNCADDYLAKKAPRIIVKPKGDRYSLCYLEFAVTYSGSTRTPLWSAEHLTVRQLRTSVPRKDAFHIETALPVTVQAKPADYAKSGYDMGHMTPANDASTAESEWQTFSLANMVPQFPRLNRGIWAKIEKATRSLAVRDGELFVVTGPVFGKSSPLINGRVAIPKQTFKAIYDPSSQQASAYVADNDKSRTLRAMSIKALAKLVGIDVFPSLSAAIKGRTILLLGF
jgi:endonuclease G